MQFLILNVLWQVILVAIWLTQNLTYIFRLIRNKTLAVCNNIYFIYNLTIRYDKKIESHMLQYIFLYYIYF